MIGYLRGTVMRKTLKDIIIDVGGIGYRVSVPETSLVGLEEGATLSLFTSLVVREDSLTLYGFETESAFELFETLLGVSGIGPKSAMGIISGTDPSALRHAIGLGDTAYLTKISGIGKKVAEKIVLELKDKFKDIPAKDSSYAGKAEHEALEALESLGYNIRDIRDIVRTLSKEHDDTRVIISKALQTLGKHG